MNFCTKESCQQKNKFPKKYIAETERKLKDRLCEHIVWINTKKTDKATGHHFNMQGHTFSDMKVTVLKNIHKSHAEYRKKRDTCLIRKFNTFYRWLNKKP